MLSDLKRCLLTSGLSQFDLATLALYQMVAPPECYRASKHLQQLLQSHTQRHVQHLSKLSILRVQTPLSQHLGPFRYIASSSEIIEAIDG